MSFTSTNKAAFFNPSIPGVEAAFFRTNTDPIYVHYSIVETKITVNGVNISAGSVLLEAATEDVPTISNGDFFKIGEVPEDGEEEGAEEEIIEEGEETEITTSQNEFYVISHQSDGLGSTYIYLSRDKE